VKVAIIIPIENKDGIVPPTKCKGSHNGLCLKNLAEQYPIVTKKFQPINCPIPWMAKKLSLVSIAPILVPVGVMLIEVIK